MIAVNNEPIKKPLIISGFFIENFGGMQSAQRQSKSRCNGVLL